MTRDQKASLTIYARHARKRQAGLAALVLLVLALAALSLCAGSDGIAAGTFLGSFGAPPESLESLIVWNLRLPRTLAAILAGAGLALSGCVMQILLQNPMASPSTLGVSNAAVFGANLTFIALQSEPVLNRMPDWLGACSATVFAFAIAMADILMVLLLTRRHPRSPETIVLAGIALGAAFTAGTTILQTFASDTQVAAAVFWTFGDLGRVSQTQNLVLAATLIPSAAYFFLNRWNYNAVDAGEECALSLGLPLRQIRMLSLLFAALLCAVTVSFMGIIGFIGLVAPQLIRRLVGASHHFLLPASALTGAALLLLADIIARTAIPGAALPVGAITSLFGAPIFLALLLRHRKGGTP